ncbi:MAG: hypothetical protein JW726_10910 [Anaerolineales bacterium]|nr:hypothetical protein [Anaerolineales bacterium]
MATPQSFSCPNCGATLDYNPTQTAFRCPYCNSSILLPSAGAPAQPDPQLPDPSLSEVAALFRAGKRVQATIRYREITGADLKEARQAIDRFASGAALRRPNRMGHL